MYARAWRVVVAVACCLAPATALAQAEGANLWFVRAGVTPSFILPVNPFSLIDAQPSGAAAWAPGITVEIGRRTDGTKEWQGTYNLPSYGFGVSTAAFENNGALVRPIEAYGFFSWPFARISDRLGLTSDFGLGLSWNWTAASLVRNTPPLEVLGSNINARIDWGFYLRYITTPRMSLYSGIDFTHRSNGGLVQPNQGINVLGPKVSVQYNFGPDGASLLDQPPAPPFHPSWDVVVAASGGLKNVMESTAPLVRQDFSAFDATAAVRRHFYTFGRIASGVDVMYDGSTGANLDANGVLWRVDMSQRWALGVFAGYEHIIGRFSALIDFGDVVARGWETPETPRFYERYGWRYQLSDRLFTGLSVRAVHGKKADALEVGVGYRVPTSWGLDRSR